MSWVGSGEKVMERLTDAGPVLVHFFDFAQLNALRTLPYVRRWHESYAEAGLTVVGAHTARFPFSEDPGAIAAAVERLGIPYPVFADENHDAWRDYGCHGWPSLFLWSKGGALRWYHFGEGEYAETEEAIRAELDDVLSLPEPMEPLRPGDAPGALVQPPTPEILPGGSEREPWRPTGENPELEVAFEAAGAWASLDGEGVLEVTLDGAAADPVTIVHPGLYPLMPEGPHAAHELVLRPSAGLSVYSVSFAAGPA